MRKIYLILIMVLSFSLQAQQVKVYTVTRVGSNDILCGTSTILRVGSKINDNSIIQWKDYHQWFEAKDSDGRTRYFSKESMESRHKRTIFEYLKDLINRCATSTSGKGVEQLLAGKNKGDYSEKRLALVIGNANYNVINPLRNPLNDASLISGDLCDLGFDVMCMYDGTREEIKEVLNTFRNKVENEHYDLVLFYYSGHGLKSDYKNWIVPINAKLESHADLSEECIDGHYLMEIIKESGCANSIVILDACRTEVNWSKAAMQGGAISIAPEQNMLLAFSTRDYEVAQDVVPNVNGNGPYAAALSKALRKEGLELDKLFNEVKNQVIKSTDSLQYPIHTNLVRREIVLHKKKQSDITKYAIDEESNEASRDLVNAGNSFREQKNYSKAYNCYLAAAKKGNVEAIELMGEIQEDAYNNPKEAFSKYKKAADLGNSQAQFRLGRYYEIYQENYYAAFQWYQMSANQGNVDGQKAMGNCYFWGIGVLPNIEESIKWYSLCVEQGDALAAHNENMLKKAVQGDAEAQYKVGHDYYYGVRIDWKIKWRNYEEARKWLQKAALQGHSEAQWLLGEIYSNGCGVPVNKSTARYWYSKSKKSLK